VTISPVSYSLPLVHILSAWLLTAPNPAIMTVPMNLCDTVFVADFRNAVLRKKSGRHTRKKKLKKCDLLRNFNLRMWGHDAGKYGHLCAAVFGNDGVLALLKNKVCLMCVVV
jgi:hypothetical protein